MTLHTLTIHEARNGLDAGDFTATELATAILDRIKAVDPEINSYISVTEEAALEQAKAAEKAIESGTQGPLTGIPVALKDLIVTKGTRTTCASKILENFVSPYDATVVEKLGAEGIVMPGKLNMDEFAMGSTNENSAFGPVKNPWDLTKIPGGSSGGSAAAVAADLCMASLGSDTGGSIRQPASHCGVVGLKPSYGRVSRYGLVAFASSLDQIGPLTKDVEDAAIMMNAISGFDPKDSTSSPNEVPDFTKALEQDLSGMTVGLPVEYNKAGGLDPEVERAVAEAIKVLEAAGAKTVEVALPHTEFAVSAYYVIAPSEASSNLARFDGVRYGHRSGEITDLASLYEKSRSEGFGEEVKRRIMIGTYALSAGYYDAYYGQAMKVRRLITEDFEKAFSSCDILAAPVAPTPAFGLGTCVDDPLTLYLADIFTISANLAGIPGLSVPCGKSKDGLPIGLQLLGRSFDEMSLLKAGYSFEKTSGFKMGRPVL